MTDGVHLTGPDGMRAVILTRGAALHSWCLPSGAEVVMGHDDPTLRAYRGVIVGRYAGRLPGAQITVDGQTHRLDANDGAHCLHGGARGFDTRDWTVANATVENATFSLTSPDGDQGFPGEARITARYTLTPGTLTLEITATVTRPCPVSLTNHAFFNLAGGGTVADHHLMIPTAQVLPTDAEGLPAGPPEFATGTLDFTTPRPLGPALADPRHAARGGLDHCYILARTPGDLRPAAALTHPPTGRSLTIETNQAALNVYSTNFPLGPGLPRHGALCLEPHLWLNAPNRPDFPDAILRPGATYRHLTRYTLTDGHP